MPRTQRALLLVTLFLPSWGGAIPRALGAVGGGVLGLAAGTGVALGVVVARARLDGHYLESTRDLLSPQAAPIPVGLIGGVAAGLSGPAALAGFGVGAAAGAATGGVGGAIVGNAFSDEPEDRWAGGVMGAAAGILLGMLLALPIALGRHRSRHAAGLGALLALLAVGCQGDAPERAVPRAETPPGAARSAPEPVPDDPGEPEAVLYLVGDPGKARYGSYPVLPAMTADVERHAATVGRDSAVIVVMLGDIVYPDGMHAPDSPGFDTDSARVADQIALVAGPEARRAGARMIFLAGNHDWGLAEDREGARRLGNLDAFLDRMRASGPSVALLPPAGSGLPSVIDVGRLRLVLLDTAWWLFDAEPGGKRAMVDSLGAALASAGDRRVVVAAHHPIESGGPHGGMVPFWRTVGIHYLLARSGAMLQDLNSRPYGELRTAMAERFREQGRPLLFAGGHEHSLQLHRHDDAGAPRFSVVSGSASKLTEVSDLPGTLFRRSEPGYMRLVVRVDGAVDLYVEAAPARFVACPEADADGVGSDSCMADGVASFRTVLATRLAPPADPTAGANPVRSD